MQSSFPTEPANRPALFQASARGAKLPLDSGDHGGSRIMACLDESALSDAVLQQALAIAEGLDLPVTAARVIETTRHMASPVDPLEWQMRRRESGSRLDRLVETRGRDRQAIDRVMLAGPAADELTGWAKDHGVALMAMGTHEQRDLEDGLGSTTQRVLERAPASLLLVPKMRAGRPFSGYRRVLVALDGSCRAESVLPVAVRIARAHGAELVLVHVVPRNEMVGVGPDDEQAGDLCRQLATYNERNARAYLDDLRAQLGSERLSVRTLVASGGDPRVELRRIAAEQQADLLIVSSHGHSGMADVPCGSVTDYLATHASTPVMVVRPSFAHAFTSTGSAAGALRNLSAELI